MREVTRSALVPYSAEQMFALVADIEQYPQFVPWISAAKLLESTPDQVTGKLEMHKAGVRETFTTRNFLKRPTEMLMTLVDGPFKTFEGRWTFTPLGDKGVKVGLTVRFEFASAMLNMLLSRTFEKNCSELIDAFVDRAREKYGKK
ncbi:type II toxin-antitoxin system RatA family toxin [Peristeroidobacter soli]|uniref:type II toxin-antitoxin system RatA family toxin n=1 Tax=Peristeroidobacter soli TaxID=2497877 RepID=UPI00101C1FD4|nr:type II toxin-antitoxin system RatA family toxin [Peristeroidobacter soli]